MKELKNMMTVRTWKKIVESSINNEEYFKKDYLISILQKSGDAISTHAKYFEAKIFRYIRLVENVHFK